MSQFAKRALDLSRALTAAGAVIVSVAVAAAIAGREFLRVRDIVLSMPPTDTAKQAILEDYVIFAIVLGSTALAAACVCFGLAITRRPFHGPIVGCLAPILAFAAVLPVYAFVYRDAAPGWHINIAEENRWAPPAGVFSAIVVYALVRVIQNIALRRRL